MVCSSHAVASYRWCGRRRRRRAPICAAADIVVVEAPQRSHVAADGRQPHDAVLHCSYYYCRAERRFLARVSSPEKRPWPVPHLSHIASVGPRSLGIRAQQPLTGRHAIAWRQLGNSHHVFQHLELQRQLAGTRSDDCRCHRGQWGRCVGVSWCSLFVNFVEFVCQFR